MSKFNIFPILCLFYTLYLLLSLALFFVSAYFLFYSTSILTDLMTVKEIRGSLDISSYNRPHFPFLSNLKYVGTDPGQVRLLSCNETYSLFRSPIVINIANTALESIDLSSLESVSGGGVRLINNPSLCYLGNLSYYMTNSSLLSRVSEGHRRPEEECGKWFLYL